jgi:hypothetical protein
MSDLRVSINESTHHNLVKLAEASGETIQVILEKAVDNYYRHTFLTKANQGFAALKANKSLWEEEIAERQAWDVTIADGVDD